MTRTRLAVVLGALATAAALAAVALTRSHPATWAHQWYWGNDGVGNYAADLTVIALGARKVVKEWRSHKAHQTRHTELLEQLHTKVDRMHEHLGITPDH